MSKKIKKTERDKLWEKIQSRLMGLYNNDFNAFEELIISLWGGNYIMTLTPKNGLDIPYFLLENSMVVDMNTIISAIMDNLQMISIVNKYKLV